MELGIALIGKACVLIKESSRCDLVDRGYKNLWSEDRTLGYFCDEEVYVEYSQRKHRFREYVMLCFKCETLPLQKKYKYVKRYTVV